MVNEWGVTPDGWIWMAVWIVALLVLVWMVVGERHRRSPAEDASEILRARFARGEINETEYEQARRVLGAEKEARS